MTDLYKYAAPAGRVLLALIFIISGLQKLGAPAANAAYIESGGLPGLLVWPTILVEVVGGIFLAIGFQTRPSAVILAAFTLAAGVLYHLIPAGAAEGGMAQMQQIMFMKNLSITGGLIFVFAMGAGAFSLDNKMGKAVTA